MSGRDADRRGERGAVMVETALVAGTILTLLVFSIQVGILGFLQLTVDAAAFVNAREIALGITPVATATIFPQVKATGVTITMQTLPAPQPSVPPIYGYNSTDPTVQGGSVFNRHGGVSMMEPELDQTTVAHLGVFKKFGMLLGVQGVETESYWQECGIHDNIANDDNACGDSGDATQNTYGTFSGNYFSKGENTPPYYASFNYIQHCLAAQPWANAKCPTGSLDYIGLGVGEYLEGSPDYPPAAPNTANWTAANNGISGTAGSSVFQAMACHQRIFAKIAAFFQLYPTLSTLYAVHGTGVLCQMYNAPTCTALSGKTGFNDFSQWSAFDTATNAQIQQMYSWDHRVAAGYPATDTALPTLYPLNPENGC